MFRKLSDFNYLYKKLETKYSSFGIIVPPLPRMSNMNIFYSIKSNLGNKWEKNIGNQKSENKIGMNQLRSSVSVDHTIRLTTYLRQLVGHCKMHNDEHLLRFLQEGQPDKPDVMYSARKIVEKVIQKAVRLRERCV